MRTIKTFNSFLIGGFECADMINNRGHRVDLLAATFHDTKADEDYAMIAAEGITTVREGIRWSVVEATPFQYDFSEVVARMQAAKRHGIQVLWDICHFGYPDGLMPSHPQFADRFVGVCKGFATLYKSLHPSEPLIVTPVNEISFLSWLGGDVRGTVPFAINSGFDVKYFLCRAAIKGVEAMKAINPDTQIMMVEPLIRVHPKMGEEACGHVHAFNEGQFEAMDIVTGRKCPELGGRPEYLDLAGFNFYYNNQWEHGGPTIDWCKANRRACFSELLKDAHHRYGKPVVLSETGHFKEDRGKWMHQITEDCITAMQKGVDLRGICIYPVIDRPDWDEGHNIECGIWAYNEVTGERSADEGYLATVKECDEKLQRYFTHEKALLRAATQWMMEEEVA